VHICKKEIRIIHFIKSGDRRREDTLVSKVTLCKLGNEDCTYGRSGVFCTFLSGLALGPRFYLPDYFIVPKNL
jgi:hypothetical protein